MHICKHICKVNTRQTDGIITIIASPAQFHNPHLARISGGQGDSGSWKFHWFWQRRKPWKSHQSAVTQPASPPVSRRTSGPNIPAWPKRSMSHLTMVIYIFGDLALQWVGGWLAGWIGGWCVRSRLRLWHDRAKTLSGSLCKQQLRYFSVFLRLPHFHLRHFHCKTFTR